MSLFGPGNKITSRNPGFRDIYIFNGKKEPRAFYDVLKDLLLTCYHDSILLSYQLHFKNNPIVDIRLLSTSVYSDYRLIFIESKDIHTTNAITLLDFLHLFDSLTKPTKEALLNNILKTDQDNFLYSYQINNNSITFI